MSNKIAILACGPSLADHWDNDMFFRYNQVIAVNTAAWKYLCNWWAFLDPDVLNDAPKINITSVIGGNRVNSKSVHYPTDGFITHQTMVVPDGFKKRVPDLYNKRSDAWEAYPNLDGLRCSQDVSECNYTFPNALYEANKIADEIGCVDIHVFGFDCVDKKDFAGKDGTRTKKRWMRELPWIKSQWRKTNCVHSPLNTVIEDWLNDKTDWEQVLKVL